ncbi:hypothetical protein F53441_12297 [Fusarium austroafricanum]|uniref:DUF6604 domain-containing protein n=1 Tax=Fusarium austroafricanum TaxID=2364996 RepID=A0A8H4K0K1_9HYPO|nr:hypothetical protein F53441_12297 [Fusarium austroafricanum]
MNSKSLYDKYKKDNKAVIGWILNVSNVLIDTPKEGFSTKLTINTTGVIRSSEILSRAKLIVERKVPVPDFVYRWLLSVIHKRSQANRSWKVMEESNPYLKRSNDNHRAFISTLEEAFRVLGGETWLSSTDSDNNHSPDFDALAGAFSTLTVDQIDGSSNDGSAQGSPKRSKSRHVGKGKAKKKPKSQKPPKEVPLESVRLLEAEEDKTEYLIAVDAMVREWMEARIFVHHNWGEVAYGGFNSAAAAGVSKIAVAMAKRTAATISVDFEGYDSYEKIISMINGGHFDKPCGNFNIEVMSPKGNQLQALDVQEHFLMHAYMYLKEFLIDFQKNRTGKPTNKMQKRLNKWNPDLDLEKVTLQERLAWRRDYTIKWLFDLVNVYSSTRAIGGEKLEDVDWSLSGPVGSRRSMFGLNDFAAAITTIAMKKQGSDIGRLIEPHRVFELQLIIDSFTVSKGWTLSAQGHILRTPPPKKHFQPRRDIDIFLGKGTTLPGFCGSIERLQTLLETGKRMKPYQKTFDTLESARQELATLGEYNNGNESMPPSQFAQGGSNGFYDYSPYLCGAALEEAMGIAFRTIMKHWDDMPDTTLLLTLQRVLYNSGYLQEPVGLCKDLEWLLQESFFEADYIKYFQKANHPTSIRRVSLLTACQDASWNVSAIPDERVPFAGGLFTYRIGQTKRVTVSENNTRLERTPLVKRALKSGYTEAQIMGVADFPLFDLYRQSQGSSSGSSAGKELDVNLFLALVRQDLAYDISGSINSNRNKPFSTLNYASVTCWVQTVLLAMEKRLREAKSLCIPGKGRYKDKRLNMVHRAIEKLDMESLKVMAEVLNSHRCDFESYAYWEDVDWEKKREDAKEKGIVYKSAFMVK